MSKLYPFGSKILARKQQRMKTISAFTIELRNLLRGLEKSNRRQRSRVPTEHLFPCTDPNSWKEELGQ